MEIATRLDSEPEAASFELARYETGQGARILVADRLDGALVITDRPAYGEGRAYLVESGIPWGPQLFALVRDYLDEAARLDACPMRSSAIHTDRSDRIQEAIS